MTELLPEKFNCRIEPSDLILVEKEINDVLGYSDNSPPDGIKAIIEDVTINLSSMLDPCAVYRIVPASVISADRIILDGIIIKTDKIITGQLKGSTQAAVFLCTIGPGPEEWVNKLVRNGEPAESFIADTISSLYAEKAASVLNEHIEKYFLKSGLKSTKRFSPGYCGWNVTEQHKLLGLLPENSCSVSLNESAFMTPRKSVSGLVGAGPEIKKKEYPCRICTKADCLYKNSKI